jgi:type IV pilus assembly protein PilB
MAAVMDRKLGQLLVKDNLISGADLETALERQKSSKGSLGRILSEMGIVNEWEIAAALGKHLNVPFITLSQYEIDPEIVRSIPRDIARKYRIVPVDRMGDVLTVALSDPSNIYVLDELRLLTKCQIVPVISFETDINEAIEQYYNDEHNSGQLEEMLKEINDRDLEIIRDGDGDEDLDLTIKEDDAPVVNLVSAIIQGAIQQGASDIHFEPLEKAMRLRYRIDGVLHERPSPPKKFQNAIISRIKIVSNMDIAEKRLPQDGRFKIRFEGGRPIDFRVNSLPTAHGEKIVIRILDQANLMLDLTHLGFEPDELGKFEEQIRRPWGMVLVTGPTGSGKSTTLYSSLATINDPGKNIITIEEPIEYQLHGINQVAARPDIGLTFANGLRAFLRQDPDIIMVGEIRDLETAEIAVKAALTGHLVLSTLHTNDAPSTIGRLTNMGVERYLVTGSLNMVVAQRLVRRVCKACAESFVPPKEMREAVGLLDDSADFRRGRGCNTCNNTGYKGRVALYEIMTLTDTLREMIVEGASVAKLKRKAIEEQMRTLRMSGVRKIAEGVTTIEEVVSATMSDER